MISSFCKQFNSGEKTWSVTQFISGRIEPVDSVNTE